MYFHFLNFTLQSILHDIDLSIIIFFYGLWLFCSCLRCMLIGFACLFPMFVSLFAFPFFCLTRNFTIVQVFLFQELVPVPK